MKTSRSQVFGKRRLAGALGTVAAGFSVAHSAEAAVVHKDVDIDINTEINNDEYAVDLGEDGVEELVIDWRGGSPGMKVGQFAEGTGIIRDMDSNDVANLAVGTWIDSSDAFSPNEYLRLSAGSGDGGNFDQSPGYFGVEFELAGQTHYGYVGYNAPSWSTGHVFALGWNDTPGAGVRAGGVPELSSLALLAAGAAGIGAYRRRRGA